MNRQVFNRIMELLLGWQILSCSLMITTDQVSMRIVPLLEQHKSVPKGVKSVNDQASRGRHKGHNYQLRPRQIICSG